MIHDTRKIESSARPVGRRATRSWAGTSWLLIACLGLALVAMPGAASRAAVPAWQVSPAQGHAAVIAQGVAPMPRVDVGWRVIGMTARPLDEAPVAERSLGFVLADEDPLLIADETTGARTLLNPGEALFAPQGARQVRASADDNPADYYALELVVAADLEAEETIGSGRLLFAGEPFAAPAGDRDLDLVRDVLDNGEEGELEADAPALLLVTEGELTIVADGDEATLEAGEAGVFAGEIALEAEDDAAYVAALIGARAPTAEALAGDQPVAVDEDGGVFSVTTYACPAGTTIETLETDACAPAAESLVTWELSGEELDGPLTADDAEIDGPTTTWTGLPEGQYFLDLTAVGLAAGYVDYFIPSSDQVTRQGGGTTRIYYESDAGEINRQPYVAYVFPEPVADDGDAGGEGGIVMVTVSCPPGTTLPDVQVAPCEPVLDGFEVVLTGENLDGVLTEADSGAGDAIYWAPLPFGTYTVTFTALPDGHDAYYVFGSGDAGASVHQLGDGTGFTFTLDAELAAADPYYDDAGTIRLWAFFIDSEATS